jgi:hypothetical protein
MVGTQFVGGQSTVQLEFSVAGELPYRSYHSSNKKGGRMLLKIAGIVIYRGLVTAEPFAIHRIPQTLMRRACSFES